MSQLSEDEVALLATLAELEPGVVDARRFLHAIPEQGFCEYETAYFLMTQLREAGWDVLSGRDASDPDAALFIPEETEAAFQRAAAALGADVEEMRGGATAVVAQRFFGPGPTTALRFDMDALPIYEESGDVHLPALEGFRSSRDGWMHACGHDAHMAMGVGVARLMNAHPGMFRGTVKLLFQPAEEGTPGGALAISARGHVDDVDYLLCTHVGLNATQTGEVACATFLGTSKYRIEFAGKGAHVTQAPQVGANSLLAAATAAVQLHAIAPHAGGWFSLNVGKMVAGTEQGVTPDHAELWLGLWATDPEVQEYVQGRVRGIVEGSALAQGVSATIHHIGEAPSVRVDQEFFDIIRAIGQAVPRTTRVYETANKAGEDGNVFIQRVRENGGRANFLLVGTPVGGGHHTPTFDIDESAMGHGIAVLALLVGRLGSGWSAVD